MARPFTNTHAASFAVEHGLTMDHTAFSASFLGNTTASQSTLYSHLDCPPESFKNADLPPIDFLPASVIAVLHERLHASKDAVQFMDRALGLGRGLCPVIPIKSTRSGAELAALKVELPLLQSDHPHDVRELLRLCRGRQDPDLTADSLPLERLDASRDEGLDFPETAETLRQYLVTGPRRERLDIDRKTAEYLVQSLCCKPFEQGQLTLDEVRQPVSSPIPSTSDFAYKLTIPFLPQYVRRQPLSPPLMPLTEFAEVFVPDTEVCQVPLTSDPATLIEGDVLRAEAKLVDVHEHLEEDPAGALAQFLVSSPSNVTLPVDTHVLLGEIQVDCPVIPCANPIEITPLAKTLKEHANDFAAAFYPRMNFHESDETLLPHDVLTAQGHQIIENFVQTLQQERLDAADATARISIPAMNFKINTPEWQFSYNDVLAHFELIRQNMGKIAQPPRLSQQTSCAGSLRWVPFSSENGKVVIQESVDEVADLAIMMNNHLHTDAAASSECVRYKIGSMLHLQDRKAEDEIVSSLHAKKTTAMKRRFADPELEDILQERKRKCLANDSVQRTPHPGQKTEQGQAGNAKSDNFPEEYVRPNPAASTVFMLPDSTSASATSSLLENYMNMRVHKRTQPTSSIFFAHTKPICQIQSAETEQDNQIVITEDGLIGAGSITPREAPAYRPVAPEMLPTARIIKSLTLDRSIFNRLEAEYPSLSVIERDFSRWNTLDWDKGAITRSPKVSRLAAEADFLISPATGVIVTNLIKVMQKQLNTKSDPSATSQVAGGSKHNSLCARVADVAPRYETLVILVSEDNKFDEIPRSLSTTELQALAEFSGFAAGLGTNHVQVIYVGGGIATLVKWIVATIVKYSMPHMHEMLMQDESAWELFLRKAGMNAYAAQVVPGLASMSPRAKTLVSQMVSLGAKEDEHQSRSPGLLVFLKMTPQERVQCLRESLGGERMLHHVNEVLETRWG